MQRVRLLIALSLVSTIGIVVAAASAARDSDQSQAEARDSQPGPREVGNQGLEQRLADLERRLRAVEYPELRQREPQEIEILKEKAEMAQENYRHAQARLRVAAHGAPADVALAQYHSERASAELAWAAGKPQSALDHLAEAVRATEDLVRFAQMLQQVGNATMDDVANSITVRADAKLALLRGRRAAARAASD